MTQTTDREQNPRPSARGGRRALRDRPPARRMILRGLAVGVVVVLLGAAIFVFGRSFVTAEPAQVTASVQGPPDGVMAGERFTISGTASTEFERPVRLEGLVGDSWSPLESGSTGPEVASASVMSRRSVPRASASCSPRSGRWVRTTPP